jgi:putative transposase
MLKSFKYRLYPTKQQQRLLDQQVEECRWLYNHLLAERRDAWEQWQESLRYRDQATGLPTLKAERMSLAGVHSQVLQNVAVRIDLAFNAFFRCVKAGETPGYPRFRGKGRYNSLTFPQVPVGCRVDTEAKPLRIAQSRGHPRPRPSVAVARASGTSASPVSAQNHSHYLPPRAK